MDALKCALALAVLGMAEPVSARDIGAWRATIDAAAARFGIPAVWIERVMVVESSGHTMLAGRPITSRAGAMGLMQLMPRTWAAMRQALGLGPDPYDPHDNIMAGTYYLRLMYERFGYPGLFGAYNAGPGRYGAYLSGTARLPAETVGYMAQTTGAQTRPSALPRQLRPKPATNSPGAIFFASLGSGAAPTAASPGSSVFVILASGSGREGRTSATLPTETVP